MTMHANDAGTWKLVDTLHVKQSGSWVAVQEGYVKQSGVWVPFYSAETVVTAPTLLTSQNVATIFDAAEAGLWASAKKKRLIVNSAIGPLVVNSAPGGSVTIEVQSGATISGVGGSAGTVNVGGSGGDAVSITVATGINLLNNGTIRGGGGGGGKGGQGGSGAVREPATGDLFNTGASGGSSYRIWDVYPGSSIGVYWASSSPIFSSTNTSITSVVVGAYTYYRGTYRNSEIGDRYGIYRINTGAPSSGGTGGNGGRGQGADGASTNGSAGSAGGTNAGAGGAGGDGGTYGNGGATGSTGSAGNTGSGAAGSSGGVSGRAILGYNRVNYSGSGTLTGGTANN